ncbi:MAG: bifunctional (p)ppGpp synthetase/guanosine-3',5'-bis(diphosphate) 3'-pyrophosphohydrolase [Gammaproteobacteria bacterium]|nr:bifunctional (p)ppGpp synthetase/guanosine-3',5'-bis(diphosphate) 3'-pyrophosphohydrolase [Gammaproteobacteria bacterium]
MDEYYKGLYDNLTKYIHNEKTLEDIERAYFYAKEAHSKQTRASGEPYIIHPVSVANTLCTYSADPVTIEAALLHDVIEDTDRTYDDIKANFGEEVANLVMGLTKIQKMSYSEDNVIDNGELFADNFQKMLFQMSKDIRVIWIKLSDRLNNMQTLKYLPYEKQVRISNETLKIYTPIAHKLGMYQIKAELEDLCFRYLYPEEYTSISKRISATKKSREKDIEKMMSDLRELLEKEDVKSEISGRAKNIYSIYNKMNKKGIPFENIYDLQALRIIVDTVLDCYKVIGIVHSKYTPVPSRFKDYIAMPKPNMYQSLHTTVISDGRIYEIQVRTHEMDEIAEYGIAAHWAYKEGTKLKQNYYESTASQLRWYSDLLKYTDKDGDTKKEDVTTVFSEDVLEANVYVFTPKNTVIALPEGSTPLDFAYRIHTRVGEQYTGAIVNSKIVPIDYQLKTGDVCEIKTSSSAFGPNENWLKIVKTSGARSKIKNFLNTKNRALLIEEGKELIDKEMRAQKVTLDLTDELVSKTLKEKQINTVDDMYIQCAKKVINPTSVVTLLKGDARSNSEKIIDMINQRNKNQVLHEDIEIIVEGLDTPSVKLSRCCAPIPGDEIIGYITKGVGIAVHRKDCKNAKTFDPNKLIPVYWSNNTNRRFNVALKVLVYNRDNILAEIVNTCISYNTKVAKVSARTISADEGVISLEIQVLNKTDLDILISNLEKIKGIYQIARVYK